MLRWYEISGIPSMYKITSYVCAVTVEIKFKNFSYLSRFIGRNKPKSFTTLFTQLPILSYLQLFVTPILVTAVVIVIKKTKFSGAACGTIISRV